MKKYIKFLNSEKEWLPVTACLNVDNDCTKDDGCVNNDDYWH